MSGGGWELVTEVDEQNPVLGDLRKRGSRIAQIKDRAGVVAQKVRVRLRWWRGEWVFDLRRGTPYLEEILGMQGITERTVEAFLRREIQSVAGVLRVRRLVVQIDRQARHAAIEELEIETDDGSSVSLEDLGVGDA